MKGKEAIWLSCGWKKSVLSNTLHYFVPLRKKLDFHFICGMEIPFMICGVSILRITWLFVEF